MHARPDVWHSFRAGYMCYEERLLRLLEAHSARTTRARASARDEAAFDAAAHYRYTWSDGWLPVARAPWRAEGAPRALLLSRDTSRSHALCPHEIMFAGPDRSRGSRP